MELTYDGEAEARARVRRSNEVQGAGFTALPRALESALHARPREMLQAAALTGDPGLRRDALRALAVVVHAPTAADFGVAAAALDAEDGAVRLEGARTFLLFVLRARNNAPSPGEAD
jgi:hypothetical protein